MTIAISAGVGRAASVSWPKRARTAAGDLGRARWLPVRSLVPRVSRIWTIHTATPIMLANGSRAQPTSALLRACKRPSGVHVGESDERAQTIVISGTVFDYDGLRLRLLRSVNRICPPWLADQRDDIVQAGLLRVMRLLRGEPARDHEHDMPASYLWKVAYSATIDEIRKVRRRREVPLDGVPDGAAAPTAASDPFGHISARDLGRAAERCLARLKQDKRMVVGLSLMGHKLGDATRILGWKAKKVENLLYRGLAELRRCLELKGVRP